MRRIRVHDLTEALAALDDADGADTVLESPPGAALTHGIGWFLAIEAECRRLRPNARASFMIDCADAPGLALAALRLGCRRIRVRLEGPALAAVRDVAVQHGAELEIAAAGTMSAGQ